MTEEKKSEDVNPFDAIRAERSSTLRDLGTLMGGTEIRDTIKIRGITFHLETLNYDDETWADQFVRANINDITNPDGLFHIIKSRRAPYVAAAIQGITMPSGDGGEGRYESKEDMFSFPSSMDAGLKDILEKSPAERRYWLHRNMLLFLAESANSHHIEPIWTKYQEMLTRRKQAFKEMENLSPKKVDQTEDTTSTESKATSSPEKESSIQTQA